jgi:hypothetical protein
MVVSRDAAQRTPTDPADETEQTRKLARYLERLSRAGFYGKVIVSFQHGAVSDVRTEQTRKLDEL